MNKFFSTLIFLVSFCFVSVAQWTQLNSTDLEESNIRTLIKSGSVVIGYDDGGSGIFRSTDNGKNWSYAGYGLDSLGGEIRGHGVFGSNIFLLVQNEYSDQIYKSSNNGLSWSRVYPVGLPQSNTFGITGIGSANNKLFLFVRSWNFNDSLFIYYSSDGTNFTKGVLAAVNSSHDVRVAGHNTSKVFYSIDNKAFYTTNGTAYDTIRTTGMSGDFGSFSWSFSSETSGNYIYYIDNNNALTYDFVNKKWNKIAGNIPVTQSPNNIVAAENIVFLSTVQFVPTVAIYSYRSLNHGNTFVEMKNTGVNLFLPNSLVRMSDSNLVTSSELGEMYISSDTGNTWKTGQSGLLNKSVGSLVALDNKLFTVKNFSGIIRSDDAGQTWTKKNSGLTTPFANMYFSKEIFEFKGTLYATIEESPDGQVQLFKSTNYGDSWTKITNIPTSEKRMSFVAKSSNNLIMTFFNGYPDEWKDTLSKYFITNNMSTWSVISNNFYTALNLDKVYGMITTGNEIFMFARTKNNKSVIYYSPNLGGFWNTRWVDPQYNYEFKKVNRHNNLSGFVPACYIYGTGKIMFAMRNYSAAKEGDSLYILDGLSLIPVSLSGILLPLSISHIDYQDGFYYLSTNTGVYASKDLMTWKRAGGSNYYTGTSVLSVAKNDYIIYVGTNGNGIWTIPHQKVKLGNDVNACYGDSVTLSATGPDKDFTWCCGLGANKKVTTLTLTNKSYTASATDVFGYATTDTVMVYINPKPTASFTIDDDEQCLSNNKFKFTVTSSNVTGWQWDFGDGKTGSTNIVDHSYTSGTQYTVKLVVVTDKGCKDSTTRTVKLLKGPDAILTLSGDSAICDGEEVSLYANSGTNLSYQWFKDDVFISGQPYIIAKKQGKYQVVVTDNTSGCSTTSDPVNIKVNSSDFGLSFTASPRFFTSPPFNVAFDNLTPNLTNYNWLWFFGDNTTSTSTNPFHSYTYNGDFDVTLIAQHKTTGCYDTFTRTAYISCSGGSNNPCTINPQLKYTGSLIICKGDSLKLQADTGWNYSYIWQLNSVVLANETKSFLYAKENGQYRVLISNPSCSLMSYPVVISYYYTKKPEIKSNGQLTPCTNDSMELFVTTSFPSYKWSTGQTTNKIIIKNSGEYWVTVTTPQGCKVSSDKFSVNKSLIPQPEICIVTVEPNSKRNLIAWERPNTKLISHYNVYKETYQANVYDKIGTVPYDSVSVFLDTNSTPRKFANRYKITLVDTCNVESAPSNHHKTIHLATSPGNPGEVNLIWSHYEGFPFSTYKIYRGTNTSNFQLIDSMPSNLNSYTDINPPSGIVFYMVSVVKKDTCYPAIKRGTVNSGPFSQSTSNIKDYNANQTDYLESDPKSLTLDTNAGTKVLNVWTNKTSWSATVDQSWLSLTINPDDNLLIVDYQANTDKSQRTATITISASGVPDLLIPVTQSGTSDIPSFDNLSISVFPNPSQDYFFVLIPENSGNFESLRMIDIAGKEVFRTTEQQGNVLKINRQGYAQGLYLLKIGISGKVYFAKVILN